MFETNTGEVHSHLNGSLSLRFLEKIAEENSCNEQYKRLEQLRTEYLEKTKEQPERGFDKEDVDLVWEQFALIHQIVKTLDNIREGTIDAVKNSKAKYMEIRTTPKSLNGKTEDDYIDAFEQGLLQAQSDKKQAFGLLSLDRTYHKDSDALHFIERIIKSPNHILKGIDISGNPLKPRTLRGETLELIINKALESNIGLAIHMGEADTEDEREDTDTILTALEKWVETNASTEPNPLFGKVRLGHCIYLTETQQERIRNLRIPIEICPTCHSKLNWHLQHLPHPVKNVYSDLSDPIVFSTDDETIFNANIKSEFMRGLTLFGNSRELTNKEIKELQSQYRFS